MVVTAQWRAGPAHLVQVGQAVGVLAQGLVLAPEPVPRRNLTELLEVHHVQGAGREREG